MFHPDLCLQVLRGPKVEEKPRKSAKKKSAAKNDTFKLRYLIFV